MDGISQECVAWKDHQLTDRESMLLGTTSPNPFAKPH